MMIKLLSFGRIAEIVRPTQVEISTGKTTNDLKRMLEDQYPLLADMKYTVAVNNEQVQESQQLAEGDHVALMPPFSGG
jgi:sulfur-carrier protein